MCCTRCKCIGRRREKRTRRRDGREVDDDERLDDVIVETGNLYYPDIDAELRTDEEWPSYSTVEEFDPKRMPSRQTFVVASTPLSRIGYPMVSVAD